MGGPLAEGRTAKLIGRAPFYEPLHVPLDASPGRRHGWARRGRFVSLGQYSMTALSGPHLYWRMK
jgi:hypothetical protein